MSKPINTPLEKLPQALAVRDTALCREIEQTLGARHQKALENLDWLYAHMNPYFFITMKEEVDALGRLAEALHTVVHERKVTLVDQEKKFMLACLDIPGSLYDTLKTLREREISYAEINHSYEPIPGTDKDLEIQRFEFDRKTHDEISGAKSRAVPRGIRKSVASAMEALYPTFDFTELDKVLQLLWLNNENYVRISPPERIARILWLYQQGQRHDGLYLDVEETESQKDRVETRILFSVGNPPQKGFMTQTSEVFQRLNIGVRRSYSLNISTGIHLYFLGTFYVTPHSGESLQKGSDLLRNLQAELYNTQILSTTRSTYTDFVAHRIMTGEEASLTNALIAFCHTSLAHNQPDRFSLETIKSAFHANPDMALTIIDIFRKRFDPDMEDGPQRFEQAFEEGMQTIENYNTGHRYLDGIRKTILRTALLFIRYILKTNFFVPEKHALAFRLDPAYLSELGSDAISDLPQNTPFRVTFFLGRYGIGYHVGFSDIARGGWRTIICETQDEYTTNTNTLFREVFVLAHTQHLKNKDIYEGGSKLTAVLDATDLQSPDAVTQRLYKLQYGFINAFLDIFVTENGKVKNPRVRDYYEEEEPIELGPDENMHDNMIEFIARQSVKRGYLLGIGIMSSKRAGINHKEYGVTSRGVVRFAEIAMAELGTDMHRDPFTVKITGGTNGDVAGNAMRLLLERCPRVKIVAIVAGSGALYDPEGVDRGELGRLLLKHDVVDFAPEKLHSGGCILFRRELRQEDLKDMHRKLLQTDSGVKEEWITTDEFYEELEHLTFKVPVDLFLPCGGRPETIHGGNWKELFPGNGVPAARVISEGANSYITPNARTEIQKRGVIVLRDASANKCGVISSSYEIMANLLMSEKEFYRHKDVYVKDVLHILDRRAEDEATLMMKRYRENRGKLLFTEISDMISTEMNAFYARFFAFFQTKPELADQRLFRSVLLNHLPPFVRENARYRTRVKSLPPKIKYAILASEIACLIVYGGGWEMDLEKRLREYLKPRFS
jgi:glutamate dehydrogenase